MRGNKEKHEAMYNYILAHVDDILSGGNEKVHSYKIEFCENNNVEPHCYEFACEEAGLKCCSACPIGDCEPFHHRMWTAIARRDKKTFKRVVKEIRDAWKA